MEKRINLTTSTSFNVSDDEITRFYTAMALMKYHHQRIPNYNETELIRRLRNDFQRFNTEITKLCENEPNNLTLSQIRNFIEHHYGYLKRVNKELENKITQ